MGASYSATTMKTQLKMGVQRLAMQRNKKLNQISVDSKQVAILLQQSKDESARIRCEMILHEKNLASCMEMVQLMMELMTARVQLISSCKECPHDLEEGIASIIYCTTRLDIPELRTVSEQFGAKFGKEWVMRHSDNASGKVNPRIVEKLSIQPPHIDILLTMLHDIAKQYQVDWAPDMAALATGIIDHSNPEKLGSIAKIQTVSETPVNDPGSPAVAASSSSASAASPSSSTQQYPIANLASKNAPTLDGITNPYPGTLNLVVQRGRNILNLASQSEPHDLYIKFTNLTTGVQWQSLADPNGGMNPIWYQNPAIPDSTYHFPFSIKDPTQQIQMEVFQQNKSRLGFKEDKLLGSANFYADNLRGNSQLQWYGVYLQNMQTGYVLMSTQYIPLNASVLSQAEYQQQRAWLAQEQAQMQNAQPLLMQGTPIPAQSPNAPGGVPPDGYAQLAAMPASAAAPSSSASYPPDKNSFADRVVGLFRPPPDSPPHSFANLSDLPHATPIGPASGASSASSVPTPYQPKHDHNATASSSSAAAPAAASSSLAPPHQQQGRARGVSESEYGPGSGTSTEEGTYHDIKGAPSAAAASSGHQNQPDEVNDEEDYDLVMPSVPSHAAGSGSGAASSSSSGDGGAGGTVYARPAPKETDDEDGENDEDLEERFKRLQ